MEASVEQQGPVPFGRFTLVRRIGAGGMGEVYLARHEAQGQPRACVVKKVLPHLAQSPQFVARFLDEAKVVVRLNHPHIARVHEMGEVNGEYYLAMEYVQGKTVSRLARRLRKRGDTLPVPLALFIGERICQGLAHAHDAQDAHGNPLELVHRDLSPANVCVGYQGEVKIIDFGAAQSTLKESQTAPRVVIGNLTYMAPEQAQKRFVDRRADVYALGVTLWELLAWHLLPQKGDPVERWQRAAYPTWEPPSTLRSGLSTEVDEVILRALAREAADRYPDAAAFGAALARARQSLTKEASEAALGRLLSHVFRAERAAEDDALQELLGGVPLSEVPTDPTRLRAFVPPTALAFEHRLYEAPAAYVPLEEAQPPTMPGAPPLLAPLRPARPRMLETVVGFGVTMPEHSAVAKEDDLHLAVEGDDVESAESAAVAAAPPSPPGLSWTLGLTVFLASLGVGFLAVWLLGS